MKNGYNVGVHVDRIVSAVELGYKEAIYKIPEKEFPVKPNLPLTLLARARTIASPGWITARARSSLSFTPGECMGRIPELANA